MILVDATTLIALGQVGELSLLHSFDRRLAVLPAVQEEVTSEPARTNLDSFVRADPVVSGERLPFPVDDEATRAESAIARAKETLDESTINGDVEIVAAVMAAGTTDDPDPAVVSDDRRVRTVCSGLGATVTGTIGVLVRAVGERGLTPDEGRDLVRRVDSHGLHMTGELREKAYELVEKAAEA